MNGALLAVLLCLTPSLADRGVADLARRLEAAMETGRGQDDIIAELRPLLDGLETGGLSPRGWCDYRLLEALLRRWPARLDDVGRLWPKLKGDGPVGREEYERILRDWHLLPLSAEQVRVLGRRAWGQTLRELEAQAARMDPERGWLEIAEQLKEDHPRESEVVDLYRREVARATAFVEAMGLATVPAVECRVLGGREEGVYPFARYGSEGFGDGYRGSLWATVPDREHSARKRRELLRGQHRAWVRSVAFHEAVPGHHLQRAVEFSARVAPLRRLVPSTVTVEGWALYAEGLMDRAGYFADDPAGRLAMLRMRLWRCARVLLDTGLHCFGMPPEEAERLLREEVGLEPASARAEVRRYLYSPTQPASYVLGWWELRALRERLAGLDERAFHDTVLDCGSIPLRVTRDLLLGRSPAWR